MSTNLTYVFFATAWSSANGGINSFNMDLCNAIAKLGIRISIFLPADGKSDADIPNNITVHRLPTSVERFDRTSTEFVQQRLEGSSDIVWVGHDAVTGGLANYMRKVMGGKSVVFHHMDYSNYYFLKQKDSVEKIRNQKHLLREADIVIGIGPRLANSAKHVRPADMETYTLVPGVPERPPVKARAFDYRLMMCGRLDLSEDKVKNMTAGAKGAITALARLPGGRGSVTLIGASANEVATMRHSIDQSVAINSVPYIESREKYFDELEDADLILMPSVKEGFGLVAWEAVSLGVPVLVSKSSGFYELMQELNLADLVASVEINGIAAIDEKNITAELQLCLSHYSVLKQRAETLAKALQRHSWSSAAEKFVGLSGGVLGGSTEDASPTFSDEKNAASKQDRAKPSIRNREIQALGFERFEDVLALTAKRRNLLFPKADSTDSSKKIKFEYWDAWSPQQSHFLYVHPYANLKQTIKRFAQLLRKSGQDVPRQLYVLRRDKGENQYIQRLISEEGLKIQISEFVLKEYIWDFCIDASFKRTVAEVPAHYIDQKITVQHGTNEGASAGEVLLEKLNNSPDANAHLVVAPGGMGKTWLCRNLAASLLNEDTDKRLPVLIQAENLRDYIEEVGSAHVQVASVFDLYDLYARSQKTEGQYDKATFELAVICGNIVLIVDGLDELATMLQERFDLGKFLDSVVELSSSLLSSHIVLTTRDSLLVDDVATYQLNISKYELLGFDDSDWKRYAGKRFSKHPYKDELIVKLTSTLSSLKFADEGGRIVPFFVDVLCNLIEDDGVAGLTQSFELSSGATPYPSNNEVIDHLIHSVFRREIRRQSIDVPIDQLMSVITELVSEQGENFGLDKLQHALALFWDTRADALLEKISLNPFFLKGTQSLRLRYDFLQSYFRSLFLIECFRKEQCAPEALNAFAKSNAAQSPEVAYLRRYYEGKSAELDNHVRKLTPKFREQIRSDDPKKAELGRRATSGALKIYVAARNLTSAKISEKLTELFPSSGGMKSMDGVAIYGEFLPLDFTDTMVTNSKFLDYKNFGRSKFDGARFLSCIFENCLDDTQMSNTLYAAEFDSTCTLGDVATLVASSRNSLAVEQTAIEHECLMFLRSFYKSGNLFDPKPAWIKFSLKVRGLKSKALEKLVPTYIAIKSKKGVDIHYELSEEFEASAKDFIDNNYVDAKMRSFIEFVR
jgi:glycosyltransferase involved in cell wall biosynthesis